MKRIAIVLVWFLSFLLNSNDSVVGQDNKDAEGIREGYESEYYYAFTEATRYMIYQLYNQAVGLYTKCLEYNPGSAAIKYQLSKIYYRTGFLEEAKRFGTEAWKSERSNRWYLVNLISIYQTTNSFDSAIMYSNELIKLEPERGENYLNLAILYQINGEYRKALNLLGRIEQDFGSRLEVFTLRYNVYLSLKDNKRAIKQLYLAHEKSSDNLSIIGLIAEFYGDAGIEDSAARYYNELLKADNRDPVSVFSYLDYLVEFRKYREALHYFNNSINKQIVSKEQTTGYLINKLESEEKILANKAFYDSAMATYYLLDEEDLRVNAVVVDYYLKVKNYEEAAGKLKKMIARNERNYRIWEQLLFAENIINQYDSLLTHSEKVIDLFEDQPVPYLYAGIACLQKKDYSKALKFLEKGIKYVEGGNIYLQYCIFMAEAYNGMQNREKSFEYYEKALSIDNTNDLVLNNYAYFLSLEGKELIKAESMSKQTIKRNKFNAVYLDTYAWILYKMEKTGKAKSYIRKAIKHGGESDSDIKEHYNTIFNIEGD